MPQTKGKGGKKNKRAKGNGEFTKRELVFKDEGQEYAQVLKMLGNGPTEELVLEENFDIDGEKVPKVLGATTLEYNGEYSSLKFLIGTEQGFCL